MKLWLISQEANNGYDTYDSAVVAAESEGAAQTAYPGDEDGNYDWDAEKEEFFYIRKDGSIYVPYQKGFGCWTHPKNVTVRQIGIAEPNTPAGVICASFNAG